MVQPQSVTLLPGGHQQFSEPTADHWMISPTVGVIDPLTGLYHAPPTVWLSRTVSVMALAGGSEVGRATVTISSTRNWLIVLALFWAMLSIGLLSTMFAIWPPPAVPPSVAIYPPVVTLHTSDNLQFLSSATGNGPDAVVWSAATGGQITPPGVFTAPATDPKKALTVTTARESDRTQTATAEVYINDKKLVMNRAVVDASDMPPGSQIQFQAIGPGGAESGLQWYLSGPGNLNNSGVYTVGKKTSMRAVVTAVDPAGGRQAAAVVRLISGRRMDDSPLLLLVATMGAFGALLGAMRSFVNYVGSRTFTPSWGFYYFSRPVFGAGLALIVFFGYRIGAVTGPQGASPADPFAAAFIAGLVGLFADTVLQKLQEVVTQLFRPSDTRTDKLAGSAAAPTVTSLAVDQGTLNINGTNFAAGATVSVNGSGLHPTVVGPTRLAVALPAALAARGTKLDVIVMNADGGKSGMMSITI